MGLNPQTLIRAYGARRLTGKHETNRTDSFKCGPVRPGPTRYDKDSEKGVGGDQGGPARLH